MKEQISKKKGSRMRKILVVLLAAAVFSLAACGDKDKQPEDGGGQAAGQEVIAEEVPGTEEGGEVPEPAQEEEEEPELPGGLQGLMDMGVPIPEKEVDFEDLQENVNEDIYAWVYIPDTRVDYPVLQHPADNYYYLNYNLDGSRGYPGCIYSEKYNRKDFEDPVTVIYGHNMKNGTMFADLHNYEDAEYFEENPYVYIYTPEGLLVYRIFAAYEYTNEHLLYGHDYFAPAEFKEYIDGVLNYRNMNCNRAEDVELTTADHILVLSTCMANKPDNRYLVQGVLLNED